ncbi:TetR/AcrR family transcriptional regulator [Nocardia alba]|uniref:TetR family transcriptional regulator n=1 Tax=Nocardia alba TaxID=225051 RepID=A0A4R1FES0_9NOCA|nr:TetR/AcrR family transcriptional regulator [Nocardia alba]TCJ89391.1 TetR family transcriptional regulator [Nocardia alba]
MGTSSRQRILDGAVELLRTTGGANITLESAAKQAGLSKPGLMYHFPTKEALMLAVVDHVASRWEQMLRRRIGDRDPGQVPVTARVRAYLETALYEKFDRADFAIYADAAYYPALTDAWIRRLTPWLALPPELPAPERARLSAARMLADGYWTAQATGVFPVSEHDRAALAAVAEQLLEGGTNR